MLKEEKKDDASNFIGTWKTSNTELDTPLNEEYVVFYRSGMCDFILYDYYDLDGNETEEPEISESTMSYEIKNGKLCLTHKLGISSCNDYAFSNDYNTLTIFGHDGDRDLVLNRVLENDGDYQYEFPIESEEEALAYAKTNSSFSEAADFYKDYFNIDVEYSIDYKESLDQWYVVVKPDSKDIHDAEWSIIFKSDGTIIYSGTIPI
jgi:hypothetical protein